MERTVAARSPIGTLDILWRPFEAAAGLTRGSFQAIARHRRLRIALLAMLIVLALLAGGWLLLRKSSFTAVEHVRVSGVHGAQAQAIEAALDEAAGHMSTLDVNAAALRAAVAAYPVVRAVHAVPSFPHGLRIEVAEQPPVAALTIGSERTAVAADGVVLGPGLITGSLPTLSDGQRVAPQVGGQVQGGTLLAELTILGAEPKPLARFDARVFSSPKGEGLTVAMRNGLLVYFGDATRPHAKWLALARVLADSSSAGATYIDVRVPERPATGFASASALAEASGSTDSTGATGTPESTVAALALKLTESTNGEPTAAAAPATGATSTTAGSSEAEAAAETEASSAGVGASEQESSSGNGESSSSGESESAAGMAPTGG
ncbi:MAG TPA: FtsQ-type POTRA domain-containing protein [Solirubrobacteraceae bacterium]|jgi:cell division protein FtsQ